VFEKSFLENIDPEEYVKNHRLEMISDASVIRLAAMKVLEDNPGAVSDYKNGKKKAFGNLVGQTIKAMDHKADPAIVNAIIKELLE
jgi:aspartyl-tRNA(Asn)/glutamyl-tRNA(Gln) amidotransferase subunit B